MQFLYKLDTSILKPIYDDIKLYAVCFYIHEALILNSNHVSNGYARLRLTSFIFGYIFIHLFSAKRQKLMKKIGIIRTTHL